MRAAHCEVQGVPIATTYGGAVSEYRDQLQILTTLEQGLASIQVRGALAAKIQGLFLKEAALLGRAATAANARHISVAVKQQSLTLLTTLEKTATDLGLSACAV